MAEIPNYENVALAQFHPRGIQSGTPENPMYDPTVFWLPNVACTRALVTHVGFKDVEVLSTDKAGTVLRAQAPTKLPGQPPDESKAPWS